jgi:hypothetical protein
MRKNNEKRRVRAIRGAFFGTALLALGAALLLTACNEFFSSTWGESFARDPSGVKVTASNVDELLQAANGDTKASRAILKKLKGTKNPKLQAAAVKAANQAGGLTGLALSNLGTLTDGASAENEDALKELAGTVLAEAKKNDISGIAEDIAGILPVTDSPNGPVFEGDFIDSVSTADLTLLLVTLMLSEVPDPDAPDAFDQYLTDNWSDPNKINGTGLDGSEKLIAAIANEVIARPDSELGKMLKSLVGKKD